MRATQNVLIPFSPVSAHEIERRWASAKYFADLIFAGRHYRAFVGVGLEYFVHVMIFRSSRRQRNLAFGIYPHGL